MVGNEMDLKGKACGLDSSDTGQRSVAEKAIKMTGVLCGKRAYF
jgi:hypothetical protein